MTRRQCVACGQFAASNHRCPPTGQQAQQNPPQALRTRLVASPDAADRVSRAQAYLAAPTTPNEVDVAIAAHTRTYEQVYPPTRPQHKGKCFTTCGRLAVQNPTEYTYVEGTAIAPDGIQHTHAWLIDSDGVVYDPTWGNQGREYTGYPVNTDYLAPLDGLDMTDDEDFDGYGSEIEESVQRLLQITPSDVSFALDASSQPGH